MGEEGAGEGGQGEGEQRGEEVQHVRQPQQQQQPVVIYIEESPGSPAPGQLCYSLGLHQSLMSPAQNMYPPCMKISTRINNIADVRQ